MHDEFHFLSTTAAGRQYLNQRSTVLVGSTEATLTTAHCDSLIDRD